MPSWPSYDDRAGGRDDGFHGALVHVGVENHIHARIGFGERDVAGHFHFRDHHQQIDLFLVAQHVDVAGQFHFAVGELEVGRDAGADRRDGARRGEAEDADLQFADLFDRVGRRYALVLVAVGIRTSADGRGIELVGVIEVGGLDIPGRQRRRAVGTDEGFLESVRTVEEIPVAGCIGVELEQVEDVDHRLAARE